MEYREAVNTIQVPKNVGLDGFLLTIKTVLKMARVQDITINSLGMVTYRRFVLEGEPANTGVSFDEIEPYNIIRNTDIQTLQVGHTTPAASAIGQLFDLAATQQYSPLGFVMSPGSKFWDWYFTSTGYDVQNKDTLMGLPVYNDRHMPEDRIVLAVGYGRDATMIDARKSFQLVVPQYFSVEKDQVEVVL